jgi:hypothetical protein
MCYTVLIIVVSTSFLTLSRTTILAATKFGHEFDAALAQANQFKSAAAQRRRSGMYGM